MFSHDAFLSLSLPHYSLLHVVKKAYRFRGHSLITIQILDTVYDAWCTSNRSLDFADFVSRYVRSFRYAGIRTMVSIVEGNGRSLVVTVVGVSANNSLFLSGCAPLRGKSSKENLVEKVYFAGKRFPLIAATVAVLRSRNIEQRLRNKQTNRERKAATRHSSSPDVCFSFGNQWPYVLRRYGRFVIRRAHLSAD